MFKNYLYKRKKRYKVSIRKKLNRKLALYKKRTQKSLIKEKLNFIKPFIFIINIVFLFTNIFLFFLHLKNNKYFSLPLFFKNSDKFNMNLFKSTFQYISAYLLNKYTIYNNYTNSIEKKVIKLKPYGLFDKKRNLKWLKERLSDQFILQYGDPNPDYLLYNCFSDEDINQRYKNIIRIAIYTENKIPDLNCADYFLVHYHINYLDRFFKVNVFFWESFKEIDSKRLEVINSPIRKKFCAAVYTNCIAKFRKDFIKKLNNYKKIDMGGRCVNSIHGAVKDKINFLSEYKFSFAMENSEGNGYITEKIVDSFKAGTIPIYYEIIWLMNI